MSKTKTVSNEKGKTAAMSQLEKLFKHTRSNSYATRSRYEKACKQFVTFLDDRFKIQNLRNVQDKHVVAYIEHRQEQGIADKTIKTELGGIRYMHDFIPNAKYELSSNAEIAKNYGITLEKTVAVKGDRAWTDKEYNDMKDYLDKQAQTSATNTPAITKDVLILARTMGLRVSEAVCMRRIQAEQALNKGVYTVMGEAKGGRVREVPLSPEARELLSERISNVERGERLFVAQDEKAHQVVNRIEKYLERHRDAITTSEGLSMRLSNKGIEKPLTFHGLRYGYVQDRMNALQQQGYTKEQAETIVTKEVGHNRTEVLAIYTNGQ